VENYDIKIL